MKKRFLAAVLALCMALTLLPANALASEIMPDDVIEENSDGKTQASPGESTPETELQEKEDTIPKTDEAGKTPAEGEEGDEINPDGDEGKSPEDEENDKDDITKGNAASETADSETPESESSLEETEKDEEVKTELDVLLDDMNTPKPDTTLNMDAGTAAAAVTQSGTCGENVTWEREDGTLIISGYGPMEDYTMIDDRYTPPYNFSSSPWGRILGIESVKISYGVTNIGSYAFYMNSSFDLTSIEIPDSVTSIGNHAFYHCSGLTSIEIPAGVTSIGNSAFCYCSGLTRIEIPAGVTSIGNGTFWWCTSLSSIGIPDSVTSIGNSAFSVCTNLTDVYYGGNESDWANITIDEKNEYLANATIHYNSTIPDQSDDSGDIPVEPPVTPQREYKVYCGLGYPDGYESFDVSLEDCIAKTSSTTYNPQLAHMLIAMCNSVYSESNISHTFDNFGFESEDMDIDNSQNGIYLTYGMAKKQIGDQTLVLIVARGTENIISMESASNIIDSGLNSKGQHSGFTDAAQGLYDRLRSRLGIIDFSNVKFVITGFSRGAAAANILSAQLLENGALQKNVYAYTFACPDVGPSALNSSYLSIFNIADAKDFVSWTPSGWMLGFSNWEKHGRSFWYCENWDDYETLEMGMEAHNQAKYLEYLRQERPLMEYKTRAAAKTKLDDAASWRTEKFWNDLKNNFLAFIGIHCPVDVIIYASDGRIVGKVTNNLVSEIDTEKVYISVTDDDKNIYLLDDDTYTLRLSATDDGLMDYIVQNVDVGTRDIIEGQNFENVTLASGKQFISEVRVKENIAVDVGMKEVKLYVMDDIGNLKKEVLDDGSGTEIPIKGDDDSDNNSGGNKPGNTPGENKPGSSSNGDSNSNTSYSGDNDESGASISSVINSGINAVVETWKPTTPDEKKRYACMGKDAVQYTLSEDNAYRIVIENAMQGPMCFKSFETVLGEYTVGRTYNVYTFPDTVYSMDKEIQFTIKIPSDIYKKDREYKMICVTKDGQPIVYEDIDDKPETITIKTNKFYAYALIYK